MAFGPSSVATVFNTDFEEVSGLDSMDFKIELINKYNNESSYQ